MPLADEEARPYIRPSLGDGLAAGAAETQVAKVQVGNEGPKTSCFLRRFYIVSALQSNRRKRYQREASRFSRRFFAARKPGFHGLQNG